MFQQNRLRINNTTKTFPTKHTDALADKLLYTQAMYLKLMKLSQKKQWILYTSNCPRPAQYELSQYHINCHHIIHIKPSCLFSEEEVVIKALHAETASAIVASGDLDLYAKARIKTIASQKNCEVFFLEAPSEVHYFYH